MSRRGIYLYGMVRTGGMDSLEVAGVEEGQAVELIDLDDLTAVVSEVPLDRFEAALVMGEPDPSWIIPRAVRHEQVIEAVMARSPVLPVRFGTLFASAARLESLVAEHRRQITRFLDRISDKQEWAFKGFVALDESVDWMLEHDPSLCERHRQLAQTPGTRYFQEKRLREDLRKQVRKIGHQIASDVEDALESDGAEILSLPLRAQDGGMREMVLHLACLLPATEVPEILERARQAAIRTGPVLILESTGPWPPFHFCPNLNERQA